MRRSCNKEPSHFPNFSASLSTTQKMATTQAVRTKWVARVISTPASAWARFSAGYSPGDFSINGRNWEDPPPGGFLKSVLMTENSLPIFSQRLHPSRRKHGKPWNTPLWSRFRNCVKPNNNGSPPSQPNFRLLRTSRRSPESRFRGSLLETKFSMPYPFIWFGIPRVHGRNSSSPRV